MGVRENIKETISLYKDMNVARPRLIYDTKAEFINWNTTGTIKEQIRISLSSLLISAG